jgi:hypothetical protein
LDQLLAHADAWIVDGAATVLQQVLLTRKPVIYVHTRGSEFYPEAMDALRQQVQVVDGWEPEFETRLRDAVRRLHTDPAPREGGFVQQFVLQGNHAPDEVAAAAADMIVTLALSPEEASQATASTLLEGARCSASA